METDVHPSPVTEVGGFTRLRRELSEAWSSWLGDASLLLVLGGMVITLHLTVPGTVPSGGDGGNWLALAGEQFGDGVMSAEVSYPPLLPSLLALTKRLVGDPLIALVVVALLSKTMLVVGTYVCVRTLGRSYAFVAAVVVGAAGALLEAYSWGGYTQLLAMGFGLIATFMVVGYLNTWDRKHLWIGLLLSAATLLTHTMIGGLLGLMLIIAVLHLLFMTDPRTGERARALRIGMAVSLPVLIVSVVGFVDGSLAGFEPTINPIGLSRLEGLLASVRDAPYPWAVIALVGVVVLFFRFWPAPVASTIAVGSSWLTVSIGLFVATGEPRALLVTQVALILLAVVGFAAVNEWARPSPGARHSSSGFGVMRHRFLIVGEISVAAALLAGGFAFYVTATDWYRVVDHAEIAALGQLAEVSEPDELVIAATGHHGNPAGWWVEGYAERPTFTAVNINFLAFPEERAQSEFAVDFFNKGLTLEESMAWLEDNHARYVVVDKRGPDAAWLQTEVAQAFTTVDDSSNLAILRAPG